MAPPDTDLAARSSPPTPVVLVPAALGQRHQTRVALAFVATPLATLTLSDVQPFADLLERLAPSCRARTLAAIKSLLSFGQRTGYLTLNVGAAVKLPARKNTWPSGS